MTDRDFFKEITVERLQEDADKLGYKIVKKKPYERFRVCDCGCNRRTRIYHYGSGVWVADKLNKNKIYTNEFISLECKKCGVRAYGKTFEEAKRNWNAKKNMSTELSEWRIKGDI